MAGEPLMSFLGMRLAQASIRPVDAVAAFTNDDGWPFTRFGSASLYFQFFPESIDDQRNPNWVPIRVPGSSHPLYQWIEGSERKLTFDAFFTMDSAVLSNFGLSVGSASGTENRYIRDINATVAALRWFTLPKYDKVTGRVSAPSRLILTLQGTEIGGSANRNYIYAIMTNCGVNYMAWFPDGTPKIARVSLSFDEIVQLPGSGVVYKDRSDAGSNYLNYGLRNGSVRPRYTTDFRI